VCGVELQFHALLTSTLGTGESLGSHYGGFVPVWRAAGTHRKGGWMVPRAGLRPSGKEKDLSPLPRVEQKFLTSTADICYYPGWFNVWWITAVKERGSKLWRPKWGRVQLKRDGTRWRTGGEVKGNLANGGSSQYPSLPRNMVYPALLPLMRTPRLPVVDWTEAPAI
jgi:hypothetical protein